MHMATNTMPRQQLPPLPATTTSLSLTIPCLMCCLSRSQEPVLVIARGVGDGGQLHVPAQHSSSSVQQGLHALQLLLAGLVGAAIHRAQAGVLKHLCKQDHSYTHSSGLTCFTMSVNTHRALDPTGCELPVLRYLT